MEQLSIRASFHLFKKLIEERYYYLPLQFLDAERSSTRSLLGGMDRTADDRMVQIDKITLYLDSIILYIVHLQALFPFQANRSDHIRYDRLEWENDGDSASLREYKTTDSSSLS